MWGVEFAMYVAQNSPLHSTHNTWKLNAEFTDPHLSFLGKIIEFSKAQNFPVQEYKFLCLLWKVAEKKVKL